jgi:glutathione S-transferase
VKLFDNRRAPNPRRVRWVMAEKEIDDVEIVEVDIFKGEHRQPGTVTGRGWRTSRRWSWTTGPR